MTRTELAVRVSVVVGVIGATVLLLLACWTASSALLLLFASALLAVFLRGLSDRLAARTRLPPRLALLVVVVGLGVLTLVLGVLLAPAALVQADDLAHRLPAEVGKLRDMVARTVWGGDWLGVNEGGRPSRDGSEPMVTQAEMFDVVARIVGSAAQSAFAMLLIVPAGLFLAAQPQLYCEGALRLLPSGVRDQAREIGRDVVEHLGRWLMGQVFLMAIVATITGLGLWALDMPLALILALLLGVLNFVPNLGPVLAIVPGLILAAGQGGATLVHVALLYIGVMLFETYVLTPIVNGRTVDMAPMLLVAAQLILAQLLGVPGVMLAAPLTVVAMVLVQRLYLERILGESAPGGVRTAA